MNYDVRRLPLTFIAKVVINKATGCWLWTASRHPEGYGAYGVPVGFEWDIVLAHRFAYEARWPIPQGTELDHTCREKLCVNPDHLEAVMHRENVVRGVGPSAVNARKTHCLRGHPLSGANLYVDGRGHRTCRACRRERRQEG